MANEKLPIYLDITGLIPARLLPSSAFTKVFNVSSQVEMLALMADPGDVAIRSDINKAYILKVANASVLSNWQELPIGVSSINSQVGDVVLNKSDIGLGNVDNTSDANKPISTATQTALDSKEGVIIGGTTNQYWRGDKSFQTLDKNAVGLGNVVNLNTSDPGNITQTASFRFVTDTEKSIWNGKQNALGFTPENVVNKSTSTSLGVSDLIYPTQNAVKTYVDNPFAWTASNYGYISWNYDPAAISNSTTLTQRQVYVVKLRIPRAAIISNLIINIAAANTGISEAYMALYQNNTLLAQSADQTSNFGVGSGNKIVPITPQVVQPGTVDIAFWIGNITASPTFSRGGNQAGANGMLSGTDLRWATADTGIISTAPATLGTRTASNLTWWVAVS